MFIQILNVYISSSKETANKAFLIYWIIIFTGDFTKLYLGGNCNLTVNGQKLTL